MTVKADVHTPDLLFKVSINSILTRGGPLRLPSNAQKDLAPVHPEQEQPADQQHGNSILRLLQPRPHRKDVI
jgi:hypothetical protein